MKRSAFSVLALAGLLMIATASVAIAQDTLTVAMAQDAKTLDPHGSNDLASNTVMNQIYQNLLMLDSEGKLVPQLAESYEQLDGKTYRFKLRKGVLFHNGEELKASDVVYSFRRAISPKGSAVSTYASAIDPEGFETPDDYTVIIRTKEENTPFVASLSHVGFGCIINEKATEEAGDDYGQRPVGTGPYRFVSWTKGDRIVLERFDKFSGPAPVAETMVIRPITEATTRTIELETGAVDIALDITPNDMKRVEENDDLRLLRKVGNMTSYIGINTAKAPFDDIRVRRAISLAIDAEGICDVVFRGVGSLPKSPMSPGVMYYDDGQKAQGYDVEAAKKLLEEAGATGMKIQIWTSDRKDRVDTATFAQAMLLEVGIEAEIKVLEWGAFLEGLKAGQHDLFVLGWIPSVPDPSFALDACFTTGSVWNFSRVSDPSIDELLKKGKTIPNGEERASVYGELQSKINDYLPWVYTQNNEFLIGTGKSVKDFEPSSNGVHHLYEVAFEE
jgi:peptide/nickel transport system substrate-binding protein